MVFPNWIHFNTITLKEYDLAKATDTLSNIIIS